MSATGDREVEVKLRVSGAAGARRLLMRAGFRVRKRRVFETNVVFDNPARDLLKRDCLLRIRRAGGRSILTYKGPPAAGRHKSREELEILLDKPVTLETIFSRLALDPVFRYEKFRTEFAREDEPGLITLDETPVGVYLELEGPPDWIDHAARDLGFTDRDYILRSYGTLYIEYCRERSLRPSDMVFAPVPHI